MACVRGARRLKEQPAPGLSPCEGFFSLPDLIARCAVALPLQSVCMLRAVSGATDEGCSMDTVWEQLCQNGQRASAAVADQGLGWKERFFKRLQRSQAHFLQRVLPSLVQKSRRKDLLPDLQKLYDALRPGFCLRITPLGMSARTGDTKELHLRSESVSVFPTSALLRCSFSSLSLSLPLRLEVAARSRAMGREAQLFTVSVPSKVGEGCWGEVIASDDNFRFVRSPCGRALLCLWNNDGTLAGLFASVHHAHLMRPLLDKAAPAVWSALAGRPAFDDIDSQLGLHGYSVLLTIHGAKLEAFSNCFYKVAAFKNGAGFGGVRVNGRYVVEPTSPEDSQADIAAAADAASRRLGCPGGGAKRGAGQRQGGGRAGVKDGVYEAKVANMEVLAPHESGSSIPFPFVRPAQLVFQSLAFRSAIADAAFIDVTVFDEHGHVCWATAVAVPFESEAPPHESPATAARFADVDFDREEDDEKGAATRWICVAEQGAAQFVIQLEYSSNPGGVVDGKAPLPRLNTITWHPEVSFLDDWWGSSYAKSNR